MKKILIATSNPYKTKKLANIVAGRFEIMQLDHLPDVEEVGVTFREIAERKAVDYSCLVGGLAIASDGGASFPGLKDWDPLRTRRFVSGTDEQRIARLFDLLRDVEDRTVEWYEALAVADNGEMLFSVEARAMNLGFKNLTQRVC